MIDAPRNSHQTKIQEFRDVLGERLIVPDAPSIEEYAGGALRADQ